MTMSIQRTAAGTTAAAGTKAMVVKGGAAYRAAQGSDYLPGISSETVGAMALWLGIVTLPPGQRTKAHVHERHESAFYMLSGDELEMRSGDELQYRDVVHAGDYLYIPANVPHVAVNRGRRPAVFIGARNEPTAQESVVLYPEMDDRVP
ncbi:MAG: cupin domain-containing protein [Mesorhizobium sp.]|nr:MAG: cupin domain-containing protein [Mesorhizobium sp.]